MSPNSKEYKRKWEIFAERKHFVALSAYVVVFRCSVREWCLLILSYEQGPKVQREFKLSPSVLRLNYKENFIQNNYLWS